MFYSTTFNKSSTVSFVKKNNSANKTEINVSSLNVIQLVVVSLSNYPQGVVNGKVRNKEFHKTSNIED
jgi:Rieske Fe-S protein